MNSLAWIGIILWGLVLAAFGVVSAGPPHEAGQDLAPHDVVFLVAGGILTCMIGVVGLLGFMGWVPGVRKEPRSGL